jgi:hypothetical protein
MGDDYPVIIVLNVVLALLVVWCLLWLNRTGWGAHARQEAYGAARAHRAQARGWSYEYGRDGDLRYRILGTDPAGRLWSIEYDADHSSSAPAPKLHFRMPALGTGRLEWRLYDAGWRQPSGSGGLLQFAARFSATARDYRDFVGESGDLGAGSATFRKHFVLVGRPELTVPTIDDATECLILAWPPFQRRRGEPDPPFTAERDAKGLHLSLTCDGPSFEVIEHLARLGEKLAHQAPA